MNTEIKIGLLGTALVLALTGFYNYQYQKDYSILSATTTPSVGIITNTNNNVNAGTGSSSANSAQINLTASEIAKHNTAQDCWLIIENKVYNVSNYLYTHPGSAAIIIPFCGQEGTQVFLTKGGQGSHSSRAFQELQSLYIGDVGAQAVQNTINKVQQNTNFLGGVGSGRGEYEDD